MARRNQGWLQRQMPRREEMERSRWLAPVAHRIARSELWRFTRRSVPRGAALGLFAAFIVPFGQVFLAAFLAMPVRANLPIAALVTLVTNPLTMPFWLFAANWVGRFVLKIDAATIGAASESIHAGFWQNFGWFLETAGVTAFGFVVLSVLCAASGYVAFSFAWRMIVARKWTRRPGSAKMLATAAE